ncbi:methyl-accepting chemotaxis protein [Brevibacillus sp. SYSU BS000544]|uniref:methyl-accepting chemotaxis protein n=1 Tax=Brevibacillus sp. SYSU BS000544 TaxID=3416443 RepID=UPI003CE4871A
MGSSLGFSSIRFKLIATILLITLIPIFTAGFLQYRNAEKAVYDLTVSDLKYVTYLISKDLANYTTEENPSQSDREEIKRITSDVAERYYKPNGMIGYAFIIDSKGTVLFHPSAEGKELSNEDYIQSMIKQKSGYIEYKFEGKPKVTAFETLPNGWVLGVGSYESDLLAPFTKSKIMMFSISILACIVSVIVGVFIVQRIITPLNRLVAAMRKAEAGDLTERVPLDRKDEFGQLGAMYNQMMDAFRNMLQEVQRVSEQVASSSEELTASSVESARASEQISIAATEIAGGSERQKMTVESTTQSLHRIGSDISGIATYAHIVTEDSKTAYRFAHDGEKTMIELVEEMDQITSKVQSTEKVVRALGEQSEAIMGIITIIREMSAQTNLLALNAAIEAARAGEQGKSFAVVAHEVRRLAEQSGQSAEEISKLIISINAEIKEAVSAMEETSEAVQLGRGGVANSGKAFGQILKAVDDVNSQIERMNKSAQAIANDTKSIISNADEIAQLAVVAVNDTQEVAAASEEQTATSQEISAASETLAHMAEKLSEMVKRFTI